jgi:undecaprenyl phosphate N,N'-diacetylbacillosamine 1-phosphate transferase
MSKRKNGIYCRYIKRLLDILCALLALIVFCWLFMLVAVMVRVKLGSPIIFKQKRAGKNEKLFTLYKFRTMTDERDFNGKLLPDDIRLTRFGRILRSTSLDELPEVWNILKGDMSVVGPRPLLVEYLPYYTEEERHRHDVRPGLSGWAQINGRNTGGWQHRFECDLQYVNECSFYFDIKIILLTVIKVVKRSDIRVGSEIESGRLDEVRKNKIRG